MHGMFCRGFQKWHGMYSQGLQKWHGMFCQGLQKWHVMFFLMKGEMTWMTEMVCFVYGDCNGMWFIHGSRIRKGCYVQDDMNGMGFSFSRMTEM